MCIRDRDVYSKEALLYREMMGGREEDFEMPDWCVTASYITPKEHIDIQAAAQYWICLLYTSRCV